MVLVDPDCSILERRVDVTKLRRLDDVIGSLIDVISAEYCRTESLTGSKRLVVHLRTASEEEAVHSKTLPSDITLSYNNDVTIIQIKPSKIWYVR